MRLVVQRVASASITVDKEVIAKIGPGLVALVGLHENDTESQAVDCCRQLLGAKLFSQVADDGSEGAMWRCGVKQRDYEVLLVSQFTLYGTLGKQQKTDFRKAMKTAPAQELYQQFVDLVKSSYQADKVQGGRFGAMMDVALVNDGPVTIIIESPPPEAPTDGKDFQTRNTNGSK
jgi:D-aminoacyl-tRNA deacylase